MAVFKDEDIIRTRGKDLSMLNALGLAVPGAVHTLNLNHAD